MARLSNALRFSFAAFAFVVLMGSLVVLVPHGAEATEVLLSPASVGQPDDSGDYVFDIFTTVTIPAGDRAPMDYVEVLMSPPGTFAAGRIDGSVCMADNTLTSPEEVEIISIDGGTTEYGALTASRHDAVVAGTGYDLGAGYNVDYGYGYGYGSSTVATTLTVHLLVYSCLTGADFPGMPADPTGVFEVQVFLGANMADVFPSVPVQVTLFDPSFVSPGANVAGDSTLEPGAPSSSGGQEGISYTFSDDDGDASAFEDIPAGETLGPFTFPAALGSESAVSFTVTTETPLPAGAQVLFTFQDSGVTQEGDSPPFGIDPAILGGLLGGEEPALFFEVVLSVPGSGFVPATGVIQITITIEIPDAYFTTTATNPALVTLKAFKADGTLEPVQPVLTLMGIVPGAHQYTFRITAFSSFAAFSRAGGGGIGGGSSEVAPATPVTPVEPTTPEQPAPEQPPVVPEQPPVVPVTPGQGDGKSREDASVPLSPTGGSGMSTSTILVVSALASITLVGAAAWFLARRK